MAEAAVPSLKRKVVLVYYSQSAREGIEGVLFRHNLEVYPIYGRAYDAMDGLRRHPVRMVIVDHSADDVSITQAVRHIGQVLPDCLVMTVYPGLQEVGIYQGGHQISGAENLEAAIDKYFLGSGLDS